MKKVFVIISVILLLAAIELYVQSDEFAVRMRPYVVGPLQTVLGPQAQIGWIKINFLPTYLEVRDIAIPDAQGKQTITVRKIRVYINPFSLLLKKIQLPSIDILEPRIHAERTRDGNTPILTLAEQIRENIARMQSEGRSRFKLLLGAVKVRHGSISLKDEISTAQLSVADLNITVRISIPDDNGKITIRDTEVKITTAAYPEVSGRLRTAVSYEHGRLLIESFAFSTADAAITASGSVGPFPDANMDMKLRIRSGPQTIGKFTDFIKPHRKPKEPEFHVDASATIKGKLTAPEISGTCGFTALPLRDLMLQNASFAFSYGNKNLTITGTNWKLSRGGKSVLIESIDASLEKGERGLNINHFVVHAGDLMVQLSGRADPSQGIDTTLTAESSGSQTLSFLTGLQLQGRVGVNGSLTGPFTAPHFDGSFSAGPLTVRDIMFSSAEGRLQYRENKISILSADIHQQTSRYIFDGSVDLAEKEPVYAARLKVIHADVGNIVALLYKPLPLRLNASGEMSFNGTVTEYSGSGQLALEAGSAYGESFTKATISATMTTGKISFPQVLVYKGHGTVKAAGWIGFDRTYSATLESRNVRIPEVNLIGSVPFDGPIKLDITSSGNFAHPRVTAAMETDQLTYYQTEIGKLIAEAQISDGMLLVTTRLADDRARMTASMTLKQPYAWNAEAFVHSDAIDPFLLAGKKDVSGRVRLLAEGKLSAHGTGISIAAMQSTASFKHLSLVFGDYRIDNEQPAVFSVKAGEVVITSLDLSGPGTKISFSGGAKLMKDVDLAATGTANLSLLRLFFREVEHADGEAEVKLKIQDEWKNPDITGELSLKNGDIKIKDVPQRFSSLSGRISFNQSRIVADSLAGSIGGGSVGISGWLQLKGFAVQDFSAKAAFDNVMVHYPQGLVATLSGALNYDGDASEQSLTGDVTIRHALYDKRVEWKSMLVDIGKGLYQKKKTDIGWIGDTQINVRFHGQDNILLSNNLAKVPLDIDVFLRGTVNKPQLLGRVEARSGTVYFRNNEFKIVHASADFVDPSRINPVLDIQAEITVRNYRLHLAVTGTADRAEAVLLSEPSLPDADIMALLATGKTSSELKGKEADVGRSEAYYFATGQLQDIVESRARLLTGVDRFQVDPYVNKGDVTVPRVTVGKEIVQNKVIATYSSNVGSTTPEQIFRLEYIFDRHFSVVGEANELGNTGADIKYRFEFK